MDQPKLCRKKKGKLLNRHFSKTTLHTVASTPYLYELGFFVSTIYYKVHRYLRGKEKNPSPILFPRNPLSPDSLFLSYSFFYFSHFPLLFTPTCISNLATTFSYPISTPCTEGFLYQKTNDKCH